MFLSLSWRTVWLLYQSQVSCVYCFWFFFWIWSFNFILFPKIKFCDFLIKNRIHIWQLDVSNFKVCFWSNFKFEILVEIFLRKGRIVCIWSFAFRLCERRIASQGAWVVIGKICYVWENAEADCSEEEQPTGNQPQIFNSCWVRVKICIFFVKRTYMKHWPSSF